MHNTKNGRFLKELIRLSLILDCKEVVSEVGNGQIVHDNLYLLSHVLWLRQYLLSHVLFYTWCDLAAPSSRVEYNFFP